MFIVFLFGACIGSFVNVIAYRVIRNKSFIKGRSYCPKCNHQLNVLDLIPILSWIYLRGRCRYCHKDISIRYPLIELLSGILALICYLERGLSCDSVFLFGLSMVLLIISLIDLDSMIILDNLILLVMLFAVFSLFIFDMSIVDRLIGFFIVSLPMYLCNYFIESFGGGDIKLIAICGFMLGIKKIIISIYIAVISASLYSLYLILMRKSKINQYIPFAPFISLGVMFSFLYGDIILNFYF